MPDAQFRAAIMKILLGLEKSMEVTRETLTTEIKELKKQAGRNEKCNI